MIKFRPLIILVFIMSFSFSFRAENKMNSNKPEYRPLVEKMRLMFYDAIEEEEALDSLNALIIKNFSADTSRYPAIILAYIGGMEALRAKHAFWPFSKLSYINSAMDILESAANKDPENLEIRFMRFSILHHLPGILGYSEETEIEAQKVFELLMKRNFEMLNSDMQNDFAQFMIDSERLTDEQNRMLSRNFTLVLNNE